MIGTVEFLIPHIPDATPMLWPGMEWGAHLIRPQNEIISLAVEMNNYTTALFENIFEALIFQTW